MKEKCRQILAGLATAAVLLGLLRYPTQVRSSVTQSLFYCLGTLVPSLFPFMVVSAFCVRARLLQGRLAAKTLGKIVERLFRLPRESAAAVLIGLIGGYPTGAKGAALLYEDGTLTEEQAGRMAAFCVSPGLAFTVTYLGTVVLQSAKVGWRLFVSVTLAAIFTGVVSARMSGKSPVPDHQNKQKLPPQNSLPLAISDAAKGVLTMCACILAFSAVGALLHASGLFQLCCAGLSKLKIFTPMESAAVLSFLWEVTGGTGAAQTLGVSAVFFAFGAGFGGLCVHLQVLSCFPKKVVSIPKFLAIRLLHGVTSAFLFAIFEHLSPTSAEAAFVHLGNATAAESFAGTAAGGLSLLLLCAAFLVFVTKDKGGLETQG